MSFHTALFWFILNLLSTAFLAFYSMAEMACVSINKVRLQSYVHQRNARAILLNNLLEQPFRLFGTTLIGVACATMIGSECARESFLALGLNPNWAPLFQVPFVIIFGELVPMFAARRFAQHVSFLSAPLLNLSARLMTPFLWIVGVIMEGIEWLTGFKKEKPATFLSRTELQRLFEMQFEEGESAEEIEILSANLLKVREKEIAQITTPLSQIPKLPSNATVGQLRHLLKTERREFALIFYRDPTRIIGVATPRSLMNLDDTTLLSTHLSGPWFITEKAKIITILRQFQQNNQTLAIVLNEEGKATGIVTLNAIFKEIFGKTRSSPQPSKLITRTFSGSLTVGELNALFQSQLILEEPTITLSQLMLNLLGHMPEVGESVYLGLIELTAKDVSLFEVKSILIKKRL